MGEATARRRLRMVTARDVERFVSEYLSCGSALRALVRAGICRNEREAQGRATDVLRDARVLEAIRRYREAEAEAWAASRAEVLASLSAAIRADPLPIIRGDPPDSWPPDLRRAVQSLRLGGDGRVTAVTLADRAAAARILGQAQGWLQPEIHVSAIVGIADRLAQARARVSGEVIDALPAPSDQSDQTETAGSQTRTDQALEDAPADPPRS